MPRTKRRRACWLVALVVLGTLVAVVPAAATPRTPSEPTAAPAATDAAGLAAAPESNSIYGRTVPVDVAVTADGDVTVAGGIELPENYSVRDPQRVNGSILRVEGDRVDWTRTFSTADARTQVTDVAVGHGGDVYAIVSTRPVEPAAYPPNSTTEVVHFTEDGDLTWRHEINASAFASVGATGDLLRETDQGVAVAFSLPGNDGVRLTEFAGGHVAWSETYGVHATPSTLRTTDEGFLIAGNAEFSTPWLLRTGGSGQVLLNRTIPGADQRVVGAVPTDDGGALLAGTQSDWSDAAGTNAWVSRVDDEGVPRWSRVYGVGNESRVQRVFADRGGVLLLEQHGNLIDGTASVHLRSVDADGTQLSADAGSFNGSVTAAALVDGEVRVTGVRGLFDGNLTTATGSVAVPERGAVDRSGLPADADVASNETRYRGQNLRFVAYGAAGETYDLVRLPGEYDEFEPHVVRRVAFEDSEAVLESATLAAGDYALRSPDGDYLVVEDGRVGDAGSASEAAFTLRTQDFFGLESNRTFVDAAAGERGVSISTRSERSEYTVDVGVADSRGESVSADELRDAFAGVDGFSGVERVGGRPVARVAVDEELRMNVTAAAFDAGLYEVTVSAPDTREAGGSATTRVVVAHDADRRVGLSLNTTSLTVPIGGEARASVALTNVTDGVSAMSMSANRTGDPPISPRTSLDINASYAMGSAGWSRRGAETSSTAFGGSTGNGTVTVGSLSAKVRDRSHREVPRGNNTITFRIDWVVDEDGIPYSVPDSVTVDVQVVEPTNGTAARPDDGRTDEGGVGAGGGSSGGSGSGGGSSGGSAATSADE